MSSDSTRVRWRHSLPKGRAVNREEALLNACRDRRVIHLGFVDYPFLDSGVAEGDWLHARLGAVAREIVGIDSSSEGVTWARQHGFEAYQADAQSEAAIVALNLQPADLVVAGEIIEHLDAPGPFLRAMRHLVHADGELIVTTPNAYRALNFLIPLTGDELVHPDHTTWHSPRTLETLIVNSGWQVQRIGYYQNPASSPSSQGGLARSAAFLAANSLRKCVGQLGSRWPYWCDGLIAWCKVGPARDT